MKISACACIIGLTLKNTRRSVMKRFSRIFAILLTVCLLVGVIASVVSASEPSVAYEILSKANDYENVTSTNMAAGSETTTTNACSTIKIVSANGNKYLRWAYKATPGDVAGTNANYYRRDFVFADYDTKSIKFDLSDYSYYTLDFDVAADQYLVLIGSELVEKSASAKTTSTDEESGIVTTTNTTTYTYVLRDLWKLYESYDEATVKADIASANAELKADLTAAVSKLATGSSSESTEGEGTVTVTVVKYESKDISADTDAQALAASKLISYADALASKRLSYSETTNIALDNRAGTESPDASGKYFTLSGYATLEMTYRYEDGEWQIYLDDKKTGHTLSGELGVWNHFTYAVKTVAKNVGTEEAPKYSYGYSIVRLYLNGKYLGESYINIGGDTARDKAVYINPRALCWYTCEAKKPEYLPNKYSMALDNVVPAFYRVATDNDDPAKVVHYSSGAAYGIDDLFSESDKTKSIAYCTDVLYSGSSYAPPTVNGSAKVGTTTYKIPELAVNAVNALTGKVTVESSFDLLGITPTAGADIEVVTSNPDINVTLTAAAKDAGYLILKTSYGYRIFSDRLTLPTEGSGNSLVYGTYSSYDYESGNSLGFGFNQQMDYYAYTAAKDVLLTNSDTGNRYFSLRRNLAVERTNNGVGGYNEINLGGWGGNATNYKQNNMVDGYSFGVIDFDYAADRWSVQVGYRVDIENKEGKATTADGVTTLPYINKYTVSPEYRTYTELDPEVIARDIKAAYDKLVAYCTPDSEGNYQSITLNTKKITAADSTTYEKETKYYKDIIGDVTKYQYTLEEALGTVAVAHQPLGNFYLGVRTNSNAEKYSSSNNGTFTSSSIYTVRNGNDFYLSNNNSYSEDDIKLPSNINEFVHITYVFTIKDNTAYVYAFVDGEYFFHVTQSKKAVMCLDGLRYQSNLDHKDVDCYGLAIDNVTVNYYALNYSSGDAYGLDDYIGKDEYTSKNLYECTGIVYNKDYVAPSGYVKVDNEFSTYIPAIGEEKIANIKNGSVIYTDIDLEGLEIADSVKSLTAYLPETSRFSISESIVRERLLVTDKVGYAYVVREATADEKVTIVWVDATNGEKVLKTEEIVYGIIPDGSALSSHANIYNADRTQMTYVLGSYINWKFNIGGKDIAIRPLTKEECAAMDSIVIKSNEIVTSEILFEEFVIGFVNADGVLIPIKDTKGGYEKYANIANLKSEIEAAESNTVAILLIDDYYDFGAEAVISISSGKTFTFDFNGKTIVHSYGSTKEYGNSLFKINDGATFNVTSSAPGAHFLEAKIGSSSTEVFSSTGMIEVASNVDSCTINVTGDITFSCGTVYKFSGSGSADTAASLNNDKKIVLNINGGNYYSCLRASYGIFVNLQVDVEVYVENANFFVQNNTYSVFHDYSNDASKIYNSESVFSAKNCKFISVKADGSNYGRIFYRTSSNSTVIFEDCTIIGQLAQNSDNMGASVVFKGNNVLALSNTSFIKSDKVSFADGVKFVNLADKNVKHMITETVKHSSLKNDLALILKDSAGKNYLDPACYELETVTGEITAQINYVTFTEDNIPEFIAKINWVDLSDSALGTSYVFAGEAPKAIKDIEEIDGTATVTYDWYVKSYAWANTESGKNVAVAGENIFKPTLKYEAKIAGILQNATLFTDMTYNLYLPVSNDVSDVSVSGADLANETYEYKGVTYYVISTTPKINDFAAKTATVSFVTADGESLDFAVALDVIKYADAVAKAYKCGSKEATLVYEMISYKAAVAKYVDSSFEAPAELTAFNASHADCACASTEVVISAEEKAVNYSALSGKVLGVGYALDLDEMGMKIVVADGVEVTSVTYTDARGRVYTHTVEAGNLIDKGSYYLAVGISAAYIDNIMTINVGELSGTYCLGKFITDNPTVEIANSVYKYAVAAENYKVTK